MDPLLAAASALGSSPHYLSSILQPPGNPNVRSYHLESPSIPHKVHYDEEREPGNTLPPSAGSSGSGSSISNEKQHDLQAHEYKQKQRLKQQTAHDKRKSVEKALKETTVIEFFEREKVPEGEDEGGDSVDQSPGGSERRLYYEPEPRRPHYEDDDSDGGHHGKQPARNMTRQDGKEKMGQQSHEGRASAQVTEFSYNPSRYVSNDHKYMQRARLDDEVNNSRHKFPSERYANRKKHKWKEHGYRITQEVEYLDRDAAQEKGFQAKDKGKAEHVKDLQEKKNMMSTSYDPSTSTDPPRDQEDNPLIPSPSFGSYEHRELPSLPSAQESQQKRKHSRLPPHAYSYGKSEYIRDNSSGYLAAHDMNRKDYGSAGDSVMQFRREDASPKHDASSFVEIIANLTYTTTSPPSTLSYETTTLPMVTTDAPLTTTRRYLMPMRRPPQSVNALTIIESPQRLNESQQASSSNQSTVSLTASSGGKKYSKIISIDDPSSEKQIEEAKRLHNEFMRLIYENHFAGSNPHTSSHSSPYYSYSSPSFSSSSFMPSFASPISSPPTTKTTTTTSSSASSILSPSFDSSTKSYHYPNSNAYIPQPSSNRYQHQQSPAENHYQSYYNPVKSDQHPPNLGYDISNNNNNNNNPQISLQKLIQGLQATGELSKPSLSGMNPFMSLSSHTGIGTYARPSVLQTLTSSGKSVISRLRKPLTKLPSMKNLRFLNPITGVLSDEEKQEAEAMKHLSGMDAEKIIASLLQNSAGERKRVGSMKRREQGVDTSWAGMGTAAPADAMSHLLDQYLYRPKKEIDDRSDDTSINPSLLTITPLLSSVDTHPPVPMRRISPVYSQPVVLRHASPTRKIFDAIKHSLWVAADQQRQQQRTFF